MATKDGFEVYQSGRTWWYWRLRRRGRIVADGSEGYTRKQDCVRAVTALRKWIRIGLVPVVTVPMVNQKRVYVGR